jgi:hypothetical protein
VRTVTSGDHPAVRVRKGDRIALSMDAYFAELEQVALRELVPFETHEDDRDRDGLFVGPIDLGFAEGAAG